MSSTIDRPARSSLPVSNLRLDGVETDLRLLLPPLLLEVVEGTTTICRLLRLLPPLEGLFLLLLVAAAATLTATTIDALLPLLLLVVDETMTTVIDENLSTTEGARSALTVVEEELELVPNKQTKKGYPSYAYNTKRARLSILKMCILLKTNHENFQCDKRRSSGCWLFFFNTA